MRIQEMKPGILHFKKKSDDEGRPEDRAPDPADAAFAAEQPAVVELSPVESELSEPRWSLVSFDKREAGGLTYPQAVRLMSELDLSGIAGLCIITDQAASRIKS
jgi:hypothetical protein